jgi:DNA polymerase-3 subunit delta
MPRLALDKLRRSLTGTGLAPAYYIHGGEGILKDEALALILDRALEAGTRDFNLDTFSAQQLDPAELPSACATLPMMAERRVVVLRDVEAWKRKSKAKAPAMQYLDRPMPETVLVMVQGNDDEPDEELASRSVSIQCDAPTGELLVAWLDDRLATEQIRLDAPAREHLLRATAGDLGLLSAEIQKLGGLAADRIIDVETVGALVGIRFGETVDDWRDAVLRDETARALTLVSRVLETSGVSGVKLVTTIGTALIALQWVRAVADRDRLRGAALANRIKRDLLFTARPAVGSYDLAAKLFADVVDRWPLPRLRDAIAAALDADIALKGTRISDEAGVVTDLVLALAARERQPVRASVMSCCLPYVMLAGSLLLAHPASAQVSLNPVTPRFQEIVRLAQDGYGDSARRVIARIVSQTPEGDPGLAEALYTAGAVASTGDETRNWFKRVAVEFPATPWAEKAELRLAQLSYGEGQMDDVVSRVTRLFIDHPHSPVIPSAALWGARAAFEQQKLQQACDWLTRGLDAVGDDLELKNQLLFAKQRCNVGNGVQLAPVVPESLRAGPPRPVPDTTAKAPTPPPPPPPAPPGRSTAQPASPWRIQVAAISDRAVIRRVIQKIEAAGFRAYAVPGPKGLTKIQAGPFASRAAAAAQLAKIKRAVGGPAFITKAP